MKLEIRTIQRGLWGPGVERDVYVALLKLLAERQAIALKDFDVKYSHMFQSDFTVVIEGIAPDLDSFEQDFQARIALIDTYGRPGQTSSTASAGASS